MKFGQVEIEKRIGRGGMADVYLGHHQGLDRAVAVKLLHAHLVDQEQGARRFLAEARAIAQLRHPNIVQVYDFQLVDGRPSIVMELLPGPPLSRYLQSIAESGPRLSAKRVGGIIGQVAKALDHAHAHGIVHRDVKPANILMRSATQSIELGRPLPNDVDVVLSDFGVARIAATSMRTATGTLLGTPAYMAPEQVTGGKVDARADIYALAVVAYEMLTGQVPYPTDDDTPIAALFKHVHAPIPSMTELPDSVAAVLRRGLAKDPAGRHLTAGEFGRDLQRALNQDHVAAVTMKGKRPASVERALAGRPSRSTAIAGLILLPVFAALTGVGWLMRDQLGAALFPRQPSPTVMEIGAILPSQEQVTLVAAGSGATMTSTATAAAVSGASDQGQPTTATRAVDQRPSATLRPAASPTALDSPAPTASSTPEPTETPTPRPTKPPTKAPTSELVPSIPLPTLELGG